MAQTYRKAVDDDLDWQQRLANYAGNKDAGLSEYQRALEVYRGKSAAGDTAGADAAKKWSDQVNTAIGGIGNIRGSQASNALDKVGQAVNSQPFQFKSALAPYQFDAQSNQAYQAALRQAQAGAQTATNNAMVGLGARGIGNSSVAVDRANQIQQSAIGRVNDTILPQLMEQDYAKHRDSVADEYRNQLAAYQVQQDNIANLSKYAGALSDLDQRDKDNQFRNDEVARLNKLDNQAVAQWYTQTYGKQFDPKDNWGFLADDAKGLTPLAMQEFQQAKKAQDAGFTGLFDGNPTMQKNAQDFSQWLDRGQLDISRMNAGTSAMSARNSASNANFNKLMDVWKATGKAPAGLEDFGITAGSSYQDSKNAINLQEEVQGLVGSLRDGSLTPGTALQQLEEDFSMGFYTKPQYDQLKTTIAKLAPSYTPTTELTKEQQDEMPSDAQLNKMVPSGVPIQDWKSWYKDPRGRVSGASFQQWQQLYGPRLEAKK